MSNSCDDMCIYITVYCEFGGLKKQYKLLAKMSNEKIKILFLGDEKNELLRKEVRNIVRDFFVKRVRNLKVGNAYLELAEKYEEEDFDEPVIERMYSKSYRIINCGEWLEFWFSSDFSIKKLIRANFCHDRFCMICAQQRDRRLYMQNRECFEILKNKGKFVILTLTAKNVNEEYLGKEITEYLHGFRRMLRSVLLDKIILGWFRNLKVFYNQDRDDYHPCLRSVICVKSGSKYISKEKWRKLWERCVGLDYYSQVHVRTITTKDENKIWEEIAKVTRECFEFDSLIGLSKEKYVEVIEVLDRELANRRLVEFGGFWRDEYKKVKIDYKNRRSEGEMM